MSRREDIEHELTMHREAIEHREKKLAALQSELDALPKNEPVPGTLCRFWDDEDEDGVTYLGYLGEGKGNLDYPYFNETEEERYQHCEPAPLPWIPIDNNERPNWEGVILVKYGTGSVNASFVNDFIWGGKAGGSAVKVAWMPDIVPSAE